MNPPHQGALPISEETELPELRPGEKWLDESDDEQIRWMLSLTSAERLQVLQDFVDGVTRLRDATPGLASMWLFTAATGTPQSR